MTNQPTTAQLQAGGMSAGGTEPGAVSKSVLRRLAVMNEPWCPEHGYGCEPSACPCGHTLRCDCWDIANEH